MRTMVDLSSQMKDLSSRMEDTEDHQKEVEASPARLDTSHPTRRRASTQGSPSMDQDMTEEVRRQVTKRMCQLPAYSGATAKVDLIDTRGEGSAYT